MPIIWVGRSMFGLSRLLVGRAISVVRKKKPRPRPVLSFPVAGIGELDAQSVSYALTQATHDEEVALKTDIMRGGGLVIVIYLRNSCWELENKMLVHYSKDLCW